MAYNLSFMQIAGAFGPTYENFYNEIDTQRTGIISASDAAAFLKRSFLSDTILAKVWELSDPNGRGYLDKQGFFIALKLVALAQSGKELSVGALTSQTAPPKFNPAPVGGVSIMGPTGGRTSRKSSMSEASWELGVVDKLKYDEHFARAGADASGRVNGLRVKELLSSSRLGTQVLGHIWDLSDIDRDGALDRDEFAVMMFLVDKSRQNLPLPERLPVSLVPAAKKHLIGVSPAIAPADALSLTPSVMNPSMPGRSPASSISQVPLPGASTGFGTGVGVTGFGAAPSSITSVGVSSAAIGWVVSDAERAQFEPVFRKLDTDLDGFVSGLDCRDFFLQSGLTQQLLAHIWQLCDTQSVGRLNLEQFLLAMHFVSEKSRRGLDPPAALDANMIPPSMRPASSATTANMVGGVLVQDPEVLKFPEVVALTTELDQIRSAKAAAERDRQAVENEHRMANAELSLLQKDLDTVGSTVRMLEMQKGEAQKRLDELEDKRKKLEMAVKDLNEKSEEEKREVDVLRNKIAGDQSLLKNQETELSKLRLDVGNLTHEEQTMNERAQIAHNELDSLIRRNKDMLSDIEKCKLAESRMREERNRLEKLCSQIESLLNGQSGPEPSPADLATLDTEITSKFPPLTQTMSTTSSATAGFITNFDSAFGSANDPFKSTSIDPFANTSDAFSSGFGSKPAATASLFENDLFGDSTGAFKKSGPPPRPAPPSAGAGSGPSRPPKPPPPKASPGLDTWGTSAGASGNAGSSADPFTDLFFGSKPTTTGAPASNNSPWG